MSRKRARSKATGNSVREARKAHHEHERDKRRRARIAATIDATIVSTPHSRSRRSSSLLVASSARARRVDCLVQTHPAERLGGADNRVHRRESAIGAARRVEAEPPKVAPTVSGNRFHPAGAAGRWRQRRPCADLVELAGRRLRVVPGETTPRTRSPCPRSGLRQSGKQCIQTTWYSAVTRFFVTPFLSPTRERPYTSLRTARRAGTRPRSTAALPVR